MHRHHIFLSLTPVILSLAGCVAPTADTDDAATENSDLSKCASGATVKGVDVSYFQGHVDWHAAHAAGIDFAVARVSDGTGFKDPTFAANWAGMKAAGVVRGAYQFFRPEDDPVAQADLAIKLVKEAGGLEAGDLAPTLDVEVTDGVSHATIIARARTWVETVAKATGKKPMIYTAPGFWAQFGDPSGFESTATLWVADWGPSCPELPSSWSQWHFWQYEDNGHVSGISGAVDVDKFNGSLAELRAFAGGGPAPKPHGGLGSLSGDTKGAPAVGRNADGRLEVFSLGAGEELVTSFQTAPNSGWSGWFKLGGKLAGTPTAAEDEDGRVEVFSRGADGAVWHAEQDAPNGKIGSWHSLGGKTGKAPAVARNHDGRLEVFVVGTDDDMWHAWQDKPNGSWTGWHSLGGPSGGLGEPRAVTRSDGALVVFARDLKTSAVYTAEQKTPGGGWTSWQALGGKIDGPPAAARNKDGRLEVFGRGTDGALWHAWEKSAGGAWSGWSSLGGNASHPAAATDADGVIEVFAVGSNGSIYRTRQKSAGSSWEGWTDVGSKVEGALAVGTDKDGRLEVFGETPAGAVVHAWQGAPGSW